MKIQNEFFADEILGKMPEVITWLESFNLKALSSRFSRYEKYVNEFFSTENPTSDIGRDKFEKLTRAYIECLNIVIIKKSFSNEKSDGFRNRLEKIIKGKDFLIDASPVEESRDFLFELLVAAKFSKCGYKIDFDSLTDVVAEREGVTVYAECKRISSEKRFEENFRKAGKQLTREIGNMSENEFGLIFIDISSCIFADLPSCEVDNSDVAMLILKTAMHKFIQREGNRIESLNEKFSNSSLAVCLIGQGSMWTKDGCLRQVTNRNFCTRENIEDSNVNKLNSLLEDFDKTDERI